MRIYLTQSMQVGNVSYPGAGFYNCDDELGDKWIADRLAFNATNDNKVIAYAGEEEQLVDFDAGQKLAPEHTAAPVFAPAPPEPVIEPKPESSDGGVI